MADQMALAKVMYRVGSNNSALVTTWTTERDSAAATIATDPGKRVSITSATVNGQSYSGDLDMTAAAALTLLDRVLYHIASNVAPSRKSYVRF